MYLQLHGKVKVCAGSAALASEAPNLEGVTALIRTLVGGLAGADVAHDAPLSQAGLDSLAFVELRNELSRCSLTT